MNGLIAFALKQRVVMVVLFAATLIGGVSAFLQLNIEAYPDPTPSDGGRHHTKRWPLCRGNRALRHDSD